MVHAPNANTDIRIALVTGGHEFSGDAFFSMFSKLEGIAFDAIEHPEAEKIFEPQDAQRYDAYVFYDCNRKISQRAKDNWLDRLEEGKGCVFMHHSVLNHHDWDEYRHIVGGMWKWSEFEVDGKTYGIPEFSVDQTIGVQFPDPTHPIVEGMKAFSYLDETYRNYYIDPKNKPLLTTDNPSSEKPIAWSNEYRNSRIVYIQPGEGPNIFSDPNYSAFLKRSIAWVSKRNLIQ